MEVIEINVLDDVKKALHDQLGCSEEELADVTKSLGDLGADHMDGLKIIVALEQAYSADEIPDDEWSLATTIEGLVALLEKYS